ncbi:MAG: pilus assembly protein PilM [Oscillospiraceae bacterium]|nr:pilus assembly protein PilM [Oscillospiraceae bacterium]
MAKQINIEIGDSFIKVALTEKKKNGVHLKKAFMFPTPIGTAADGMITDPSALGSALTPKLHENGMGNVKNVIFTIISGKIATREVMLPPVKSNRIKPLIESNSSEYFPVDVSRYLITYGMLKTVNEGHESGSHLMALAAPLQLLDGYLKLAEKMNLEISGIDYGGNSLFQVIKALGTKNITMCITVGSNHTYITITKGDRLILQRILPWGGDDYMESYLSAVGKEDGDYEEAFEKCCVPLKNLLAEGVLDYNDVTRSLTRIVGGMSRSMDFFHSSRWSAPLDNIILTGTHGNLAGLSETLSETLGGATVQHLDETPFVSALSGNPATISKYIYAYGSSFAPVDLLPDKYKVTKEKKKNSEHGIVGAVAIFAVCVLAGLVLSLFSIFNYNMYLRDYDDLMYEIESAKLAEGEYDIFVLYLNGERSFVTLEDATFTNNSDLALFFTELEEKMPSNMLLLSALCTNEGVVMNIRTPSLEAAAKAITEFRTFESIGELEISAIAEGVDEAGFSLYTFSVNCLYEKTQAPPPVRIQTTEEVDE